MQKEWFFIDTGHQDAAVNMAFDECLIDWQNEGKIGPTLRFYGWNKPSLSVGYHQNVERTIDLEVVKKYDCHFVRRLTGGSAVLHDDELTYSLVISEQDPGIPKTVKDAYFILSKGILEGFQNLGIDVEYAILEKQMKRGRNAICFERPAIYEMMVDGKKLSGNAQTRLKGVLMQHGSIPMSMNINMLFDLFRFPSETSRARRRNSFHQKAITINEATKKTNTYETVAKAFKNGFETGLGLTFTPLELTASNWEEVYQLAKTKYETEDWNINSSKGRVISG